MHTHLTLPAELTIYVAADLRSQWLAWLDGLHRDAPDLLAADGAAVAEVDAAGVQCLLALQRSLHGQGRTLQLTQASDTLRHACVMLGATALLSPSTEAP